MAEITPAGYYRTAYEVSRRTGRHIPAGQAGVIAAHLDLNEEVIRLSARANTQPTHERILSPPVIIDETPFAPYQELPRADVFGKVPWEATEDRANIVVIDFQRQMEAALEQGDRDTFFRVIDRITENYSNYTDLEQEHLADLAYHFHGLFRERFITDQRIQAAVIPETPIRIEAKGIVPLPVANNEGIDNLSINNASQDEDDHLPEPMTDAQFESILDILIPTSETDSLPLEEESATSITNETASVATTITSQLASVEASLTEAQDEILLEEESTRPSFPNHISLGTPTTITLPEALPSEIVQVIGGGDKDDFRLDAGDTPFIYGEQIEGMTTEERTEAQSTCDSINSELGIELLTPDSDLAWMRNVGTDFIGFLIDNGVYRDFAAQAEFTLSSIPLPRGTYAEANIAPEYLAARLYQDVKGYIDTYLTMEGYSLSSLTIILTEKFSEFGFFGVNDEVVAKLIHQITLNSADQLFQCGGLFVESHEQEIKLEAESQEDTVNLGEQIADTLHKHGFVYASQADKSISRDISAGLLILQIRTIIDDEYKGTFHRMRLNRITELLNHHGFISTINISPRGIQSVIKAILSETRELDNFYPMVHELDLRDSLLRRVINAREEKADAVNELVIENAVPEILENRYAELEPTERVITLTDAFERAYQEDDRVLFNETVDNIVAEYHTYNYWEIYQARQLIEHYIYLFETNFYEWQPENTREFISNAFLKIMSVIPGIKDLIVEDENELDLQSIQLALEDMTEYALTLHRMAENPKLAGHVNTNAPISGFLRHGFNPYGSLETAPAASPPVVLTADQLLQLAIGTYSKKKEVARISI